MPRPETYQFNLSSRGRPQDAKIDEFWYPGLRSYWQKASSKRTVDPIFGIRAVVIHATAGSSSAGAISVIKGRSASFHWLVPDENEEQHGQFVWACIPEARAAWHVRNTCSHPAVNHGAKRINHWSLGIELVNAQTRGDAFSDWQIAATAQIVRYCWAKYPNLKHIVSHARLDPDRRNDPGVNFDWARFKSLVLQGPQELPLAVANATPASRIAATDAGNCSIA